MVYKNFHIPKNIPLSLLIERFIQGNVLKMRRDSGKFFGVGIFLGWEFFGMDIFLGVDIF